MNAPELYLSREGGGRPLLMLHGWAMHGGLFDGLSAVLADAAEVWRVDLPGHGFSRAEHLTQAESLLGALLPEDCVLLGWSLGGQIALRLALAYPERVRALILVGTTPRFVNGGDWTAGVEPAVLQQFAADLERDAAAALQRFLALQVRGLAAVKAPLGQLRADLAARPAARPLALAEGLARLLDTDLRSALGAVRQPALVLHGAADKLTPSAAGRWLAAHLPRARWVEIPHAAHAPFLSHAAETLAAVRGFLAQAEVR